MRNDDLLHQVGRLVAEREVLARRVEELTRENAQLKHLLRERDKELDQESWNQWLEATREAARK